MPLTVPDYGVRANDRAVLVSEDGTRRYNASFATEDDRKAWSNEVEFLKSSGLDFMLVSTDGVEQGRAIRLILKDTPKQRTLLTDYLKAFASRFPEVVPEPAVRTWREQVREARDEGRQWLVEALTNSGPTFETRASYEDSVASFVYKDSGSVVFAQDFLNFDTIFSTLKPSLFEKLKASNTETFNGLAVASWDEVITMIDADRSLA